MMVRFSIREFDQSSVILKPEIPLGLPITHAHSHAAHDRLFLSLCLPMARTPTQPQSFWVAYRRVGTCRHVDFPSRTTHPECTHREHSRCPQATYRLYMRCIYSASWSHCGTVQLCLTEVRTYWFFQSGLISPGFRWTSPPKSVF